MYIIPYVYGTRVEDNDYGTPFEDGSNRIKIDKHIIYACTRRSQHLPEFFRFIIVSNQFGNLRTETAVEKEKWRRETNAVYENVREIPTVFRRFSF